MSSPFCSTRCLPWLWPFEWKVSLAQKAWMRLVDDKFPGTDGLKDFALLEEWYSLKNFAPDLHVLLVQGLVGAGGRFEERGRAQRQERGAGALEQIASVHRQTP